MKIIQIITKLEKGGAQLTVLEILRNKKDSVLITGRDGVLKPSALKEFKSRIYTAKSLRREINPVDDIAALWQIIKIIRILKKEGPCLVHTNSSKAGLLGRWACFLLSVPCVHTVHGWSFNPRQNPLFTLIAVFLERVAAVFTGRLIVVTTEDERKGLKNKIGNRKKYALARAVVDLKPFLNKKPPSNREKLFIPEGFAVVGTVSNFKKQKAPLDFIMTASIVVSKRPETIFLYAGGGPLMEEAERKAEKLGLKENIRFLGWRDDIPELLAAMDVFLLMSLWEGLPQTIIQAMASGKPVVATSVDGSKEIVKDGINGFLISPGKPAEAAEKVLFLLSSSDLRKKMGEEGVKTVEKGFSIQEMMDSLEKAWTDVRSPLKEIGFYYFKK
ncbi:glycosyltransferase family 4 protein [candidate division WOR-3 bacterium]|nr:glycosyltransferase family 4 protein [candidate division WOR-3 bacterium]